MTDKKSWAVYASLDRRQPVGTYPTYEEAKRAAQAMGHRCVQLDDYHTYYRGADSFWYKY